MMPNEPSLPATTAAETAAPPIPIRPPAYRWYHKFFAVVFVTVCLGIGIFLVVFPWVSDWDGNYFYNKIPQWQEYWDNMYVRGAISGLGVVNLYISFVEALRLRRFAKR